MFSFSCPPMVTAVAVVRHVKRKRRPRVNLRLMYLFIFFFTEDGDFILVDTWSPQ